MCIVLPCIWIFLCKSNGFALCSNLSNLHCPAYCFQPVRYIIVEDFGCLSAIFTSYVSIFILLFPPFVMTVAALVYGSEQASCNNLASTCLICSPATAIAFYHLIRNHRIRTKILTPHLASLNSGLSSSQYYRLMAMSMVIGIWGVVWCSLQLGVVIEGGICPLPSWHELHKGDSIVIQLPIVDLGPGELAGYRLLWWGIIGAAYLFFVLFGTSKEVFSEYTRLWTWFSTTVLRRLLPAKERSMPMPLPE
jgi:pheromone a factor receptor